MIEYSKYSQKIFFFRFTVQNEWTFSKWIQGNTTIQCSDHVDPLAYLYRFKKQSVSDGSFPDELYQNLQPNSPQRQLIKSITEFYVNFAKYGLEPNGFFS